MKKLKKTFKKINDFLFEVLIGITVIWAMYIAICCTIEIPILGTIILAISVYIVILNRKRNSEKDNSNQVNQP